MALLEAFGLRALGKGLDWVVGKMWTEVFAPKVSTTEPKCREQVSMVSKPPGGQQAVIPVVCLRLRLFGGGDHKCSAVVTGVDFQGTALVSHHSPLQWTHMAGTFDPQVVGESLEAGRDVDLAVGGEGWWRLTTQDAISWAQKLTEPGVYVVRFEVRAPEIRKQRGWVVSIVFDGTIDGFKFQGPASPA